MMYKAPQWRRMLCTPQYYCAVNDVQGPLLCGAWCAWPIYTLCGAWCAMLLIVRRMMCKAPYAAHDVQGPLLCGVWCARPLTVRLTMCKALYTLRREWCVSSIVADPILMLVKCNSFFYEKNIYFVLSALIPIRFDVSQLLTLLSSLLRVNANPRPFSSANEVDRVQSSANSINLNKHDEFGRSFINIRNNNGPRTDPCGTP